MWKKQVWFPLFHMKPGQVNRRIPSFTMIDMCWTFTHAKIPLKSVGRFPWTGKLVQLHKFCLPWVAMIQKISHTGKQRNSSPYFSLNIFYDWFYVVGFVNDMWKPAQGKICGAFSQLQDEFKQALCIYCTGMMKRVMLSPWQRGFGGCHVPLSLLLPPGQHKQAECLAEKGHLKTHWTLCFKCSFAVPVDKISC